MKRLALGVIVATCIAASVVAATARADGDPASDYLLSSQVFLPFDAKIPKPKQRELIATLADANRKGYKVRAAVIASAYDLGAVTSLWRKPQTYARFLSEEIRFVYANRLLIVMPNGFGFYWHGHSNARQQQLLAKIPVKGTPVGMVDAAKQAVVQLAAAEGIKVEAAGTKGPSRGTQRLIIVLVAVGAIALLVLLRLALRRRGKTA
jgi:hypothetical protein